MNEIQIDEDQVLLFAKHLNNSDEVKPFDYCSTSEGNIYPTRFMPGVIDYFFCCTSHQFGFWNLEGNRYGQPMVVRIDGFKYKGSDYLWRCATRAWVRDKQFFSPLRVQNRSDREWNEVFCDDKGKNPLPMWQEHLAIFRGYSRWLATKETTPEAMIAFCNRQKQPLATLVSELKNIPGYREDPLKKKLFLLAIIMENRPEHFLQVSDPDSYRPIIDYHLLRSALRTGLVRITKGELRNRLTRRELVSKKEEKSLRQTTYRAMEALRNKSGVSIAALDYFFFLNRKRCPEMTEPKCEQCPVNRICAREIELFQPVIRTTDY